MTRSVYPSRRLLLAAAGAAPALAALPRLALAQDNFQSWLQVFKEEAVRKGIRRATVEAAFVGVQPIPRVLELDHKQPETTLTFDQYMEKIVTAERVALGKQHLDENRQLLTEIGQRFGVQPRFIVALWGIESKFGKITGDYSIVGALATLAYDGRRGDFFRGELLAALRILDQGHIRPGELRGSWAGAMGQIQFMPSSFLAYAVDYDGDGKQDIWGSLPDVFASVANYLSRCGWNGRESWGQGVKLPPGFNPNYLNGKTLQSTAQWSAMGVRGYYGEPLVPSASAGLVQPGGPENPQDPVLMTFNNYRVIMKWNRSLYFATAVSYIADRIGN